MARCASPAASCSGDITWTPFLYVDRGERHLAARQKSHLVAYGSLTRLTTGTGECVCLSFSICWATKYGMYYNSRRVTKMVPSLIPNDTWRDRGQLPFESCFLVRRSALDLRARAQHHHGACHLALVAAVRAGSGPGLPFSHTLLRRDLRKYHR